MLSPSVAEMSLTRASRPAAAAEHVVAHVDPERERLAQEELQAEAAVAGDAARQRPSRRRRPGDEVEVEVGDRAAEAASWRARASRPGRRRTSAGGGGCSCSTANVRSSSGPPREVSWRDARGGLDREVLGHVVRVREREDPERVSGTSDLRLLDVDDAVERVGRRSSRPRSVSSWRLVCWNSRSRLVRCLRFANRSAFTSSSMQASPPGLAALRLGGRFLRVVVRIRARARRSPPTARRPPTATRRPLSPATG